MGLLYLLQHRHIRPSLSGHITSTVRFLVSDNPTPPQKPGRWGKRRLFWGSNPRLAWRARPLPQDRKAGVRKARDISRSFRTRPRPSDNLIFLDAIYDFLVHLRRAGRVQGSSSFQGDGTPVPCPSFGRGHHPPSPKFLLKHYLFQHYYFSI